ncbi:MAG: S1C family serine protease [Alphaproteobacteria bacterium]
MAPNHSRAPCASTWRPALLALGLGLLAACAAATTRTAEDGAKVEEPAALSFPYAVEPGVDFPDFRAVAEGNAGIYVRVRVIAEETAAARSEAASQPSSVLNFASGFIVDARGYVVTAAHIANSTAFKAEVVTLDGRRFSGRIVAVERAHELALIKIDPYPGMMAARFADSSTLAAGEPALAIGTPKHHGGIVSVGRILDPRLARRIQYNDYGYDDAIALAMSIDTGHSGGPVLDREGRVIGMIASFLLGEGGSKAKPRPPVGLAVPANDIAAFLKRQTGG